MQQPITKDLRDSKRRQEDKAVIETFWPHEWWGGRREEAHRLMYLTDGGEEIAGAGSSLKAHLPVDLPSDQKIAMTDTSDQSEFPL